MCLSFGTHPSTLYTINSCYWISAQFSEDLFELVASPHCSLCAEEAVELRAASPRKKCPGQPFLLSLLLGGACVPKHLEFLKDTFSYGEAILKLFYLINDTHSHC